MAAGNTIGRVIGWLAAVAAASVVGSEEDPVLDGFIRRALDGNPGIRVMAFRTEAARAAYRQARSATLPRMSASAAYARTDNPPQAFMMALNQGRLDMSDPCG